MIKQDRLQRRGGFTLVELLVVISIIALLISILLPSLGKARDQAKAVVCAARVKSITLAVHLYGTEENGFIPGSPNTSGSVLFTRQGDSAEQLANLPSWPFAPTQVYDFMGGMYRQMNMGLSNLTLAQRFDEIRRNKIFQCPSNKFIVPSYRSAPFNYGDGPMISYNTARNFLLPANRALMASKFRDPTNPSQTDARWDTEQGAQSQGETGGGVGWINYLSPDQNTGFNEGMPPGYVPLLEKVGPGAGKVYMADGCRYARDDLEIPDYDGHPFAAYGGAFSDPGPYSKVSRSWHRTQGDPNLPVFARGGRDIRIWSYRHGTRERGARWGRYKMDVAFYDGHVERMDDSNSANPHLWIPAGGRLRMDDRTVFRDVKERWSNGEAVIRIR